MIWKIYLKNAKFGDKFRTRDGRMAVFVNWSGDMTEVFLYVKERDIEFYGEERYNLNGITSTGSTPHDIISEWQEPIDEEELDTSPENESCGLFEKGKI